MPTKESCKRKSVVTSSSMNTLLIFEYTPNLSNTCALRNKIVLLFVSSANLSMLSMLESVDQILSESGVFIRLNVLDFKN